MDLGVVAYLDAGTGSMVVAAIAGGTAGIAVLVKMYWNRLLGVFSSKRREQAADAQRELTGDQR